MIGWAENHEADADPVAEPDADFVRREMERLRKSPAATDPGPGPSD